MEALSRAGRVVCYGDGAAVEGAVVARTAEELVAAVDARVEADLRVRPPQPDLRYRHVVKEDAHYYLLCNEGLNALRITVEVAAKGRWFRLDPETGEETGTGPVVDLDPYTIHVLKVV